MEPTHETVPAALELPTPVRGSADTVAKPGAELKAPSPETKQTVPVQASQGGSSQDDTANAGQSSNATPIQAQPTPAGGLVVDDAALIADDADLIEKEWITRAKSIVEQTKTDPYAQNRELSKVKAEYIKKRYNKDIKVSED